MPTKIRRVLISIFITAITVIILGVQPIATKENTAVCQRTLPENIELSRDLERTLAKIYRRSATFRAQCDRIAEASTLSVIVRLDSAIPSSCQAFTVINRRGHHLRADVHLPPAVAIMAMLVGHEFEHIVEQLDGLDLRTLARIRGSGVHESSPEVYESDRAGRAGRVVASEIAARQMAD